MKIGIIGSDDRAVAIGRLLATGHELSLSDPSDPERAEEAAREIGAETEVPYRQAITRDVLVFAMPPRELDSDLTAMGAHPEAIVVDATDGASDGNLSLAEILARKVDDHRVVRALVVLPQAGANVPICGDDPIAKETVDAMFREAGCVTTDRGPMAAARELEAPNAA